MKKGAAEAAPDFLNKTEPSPRPSPKGEGDLYWQASQSGLSIEREMQQQLFQSEDAKEGLAAYVGKRVAEFKGR